MMNRLRRYIVAGMLVWLPLLVTFVLLRFIIGLMDRSMRLIPPQYRPDQLLGFEIWGLGALLTIILLILTGMLAANFVGRAFIAGWERLMNRIPIVRSIYSAAKNFAEIVFSDSSQAFKRVLLVEYPRKGLYSLAFQTGDQLGEVQAKTGDEVVACFLPTTPNPTSGFIILVPRKDITVLDMEVDDALKMIISLGVVVPKWRGPRTPELPLGTPVQPE